MRDGIEGAGFRDGPFEAHTGAQHRRAHSRTRRYGAISAKAGSNGGGDAFSRDS